MKTVFLVRHAKSSWQDSSLDDIDRPLNARGLRDAPYMANMLSGRGVKPDRLLVSPAQRTQATAAFFSEAFQTIPAQLEIRQEIYEAYPDELLHLIQSLDNAWSTVLLFGHNPTLTSLANEFTEEYIPNVPTCGIVQLDADLDQWDQFGPDTARLAAFYYPKQFFK